MYVSIQQLIRLLQKRGMLLYMTLYYKFHYIVLSLNVNLLNKIN